MTTVDAATAAFLGVVAALCAADAWHRARGSTLAAAAAWGVAAAAFFAVVEIALAWRGGAGDSLGASLARYAAVAGTFCPLMAVLGAKRPQDHGWQWVVLSLWIVLLVPAGQTWAARSGDRLELSTPWPILIGGLLTIELLNYVPTRFGLPALLFAGGQLALLHRHLGIEPLTTAPSDRVAGGAALVLAAMLARELSRRDSRATLHQETEERRLTRRWLAFRNGWGAFWGLRVLNRINETAALSGWPVRLQWGGFASTDGAAPPEINERVAAQIDQAMDSLLRRFERLDERSA